MYRYQFYNSRSGIPLILEFYKTIIGHVPIVDDNEKSILMIMGTTQN